MKSNKVLVLSLHHPDLIPGGSQQVAYNLHQGLIAKKKDSYFIGFHQGISSSYISSSTPLTKMPERKNEYIVNLNSFNYNTYTHSDPWAFRALVEFICRLQPRLIYVHHFLLIGVDLICLLKNVLPNTKIIFTAHEFLSVCKRDGHLTKPDKVLCTSQTPFDCMKCFPQLSYKYFSLQRSLFGRMYKTVDKVIAPSKSCLNVLISNYPFIKSKSVVVPNGSFNKKGLNFRPPNVAKPESVAFFGQVLADKGISQLIDAFEILQLLKKEVSLDIWGSGFDLNSQEFKSSILEKSNLINSKIKNSVNFKGSYKNSEVLKAMSSYNILVFPSTWPETFSMVMSEAIVSGCKIVAPKIGAFEERAKAFPGKVYLYEFNSTSDLAEKLRLAIDNKINKISKPLNIEILSIEDMTNNYLAV